MTEQPAFWVIVIAAIFTNNILLSNFLGMCSFLAVSKRVDTAIGLGLAVVFVCTATSGINWLIYYGLLSPDTSVISRIAGKPVDLTFLQFILFIAVIAGFVQLVEMIVEKISEQLYMALGIFLPLITVNCAILGACLLMIIREYDMVRSVAYGLGSGLGWMLAIVAIAGIRERLRFSNIPKPMQGVGIVMVVTGLMAMAFIGFAGMVSL
jgi:Na+-transporting NADH:ubiquinone oxidoreductase subunit E